MKSFGQNLQALELDETPVVQYQSYHQRHQVRINGRVYDHFKPQKYRLDQKFIEIMEIIEHHYRGVFYSKPDQVRIEQWMKKLCDNCCEKVPLMKNRNRYAKLLKLCIINIKRLEGVFKKMPPSDGEDLRMIQNHEILDIEHQTQCNNKKQKKSQKKALELYQLNSQKAKFNIESHRNHGQSDQTLGQSQTRVVGTVLRGANGKMTFIEDKSNNSRTRNGSAQYDEYFKAAQSLTPISNNKSKSRVQQYQTVSSIKRKIDSKENTFFDPTISPINQKSNAGTTHTSVNHTAVKSFVNGQSSVVQQKQLVQEHIKNSQQKIQQKKHNFLFEVNADSQYKAKQPQNATLNQRSHSYVDLQIQNIPPLTQNRPSGTQPISHFTSVQVETYRTQASNETKRTRRSRAERQACRSQSANSVSSGVETDSFHGGIGSLKRVPIYKQNHEQSQVDNNHNRIPNNQQRKVFNEKTGNIINQRQGASHKYSNSNQNHHLFQLASQSSTPNSEYLSPNFLKNHSQSNNNFNVKNVPRIQIERIDESIRNLKNTQSSGLFSPASSHYNSNDIIEIIQSAEVIQTLKELQDLRNETQRLLSKRDKILKHKHIR
ncbi:UNKNOWN [Stylonychia lemnae]|uniref:DUF4485 domain-containing protein n=1 Tax=Stylonychia lemnae TaxID=5949 RepID=A0A078ALP4_STYLE|nr:UNKNOWN [Stylonychia lemnae]|eukprot:CDW83149.1 UNKNOWN [Stylonychia lemnae]